FGNGNRPVGQGGNLRHRIDGAIVRALMFAGRQIEPDTLIGNARLFEHPKSSQRTRARSPIEFRHKRLRQVGKIYTCSTATMPGIALSAPASCGDTENLPGSFISTSPRFVSRI